MKYVHFAFDITERPQPGDEIDLIGAAGVSGKLSVVSDVEDADPETEFGRILTLRFTFAEPFEIEDYPIVQLETEQLPSSIYDPPNPGLPPSFSGSPTRRKHDIDFPLFWNDDPEPSIPTGPARFHVTIVGH